MRVLLGARDMQKGEEAAKSINAANVQPIEIDIDRSESIAAAAKEVQKSYGGLDLLVCNAGIAFKGERRSVINCSISSPLCMHASEKKRRECICIISHSHALSLSICFSSFRQCLRHERG